MSRFLPWFLAVLLLGGCSFPVREEVDLAVGALAARSFDEALFPAEAAPSEDWPRVEPATGQTAQGGEEERCRPVEGNCKLQVASCNLQNEKEGKPTLGERLKIPPELPGATVPPLRMPAVGESTPKERQAAVERLYPPLPVFEPEPPLRLGPEGRPWTLSDLQRLGLSNSPLIRQAAADVEAARGAAIEAGLYPNPNFGYEGDTTGTGGAPGVQGAFLEQTIKTGGKLKLAQAAAVMDVLNAQLALRRAQADLAAQVRAGYFAVLVARNNLATSRALARLTDEVFRIQIDQVQGAQAALYEPLQLRVLAMQARANLVQARNRSVAAWKQLSATLGLPALPPTELAGAIDVPIPVYHYAKALEHVLHSHTDVLRAENTIRKARLNLRLQQVTPVPDIDLRLMVQKDFTAMPNLVVPSVVVGIPFPVWDRNQGNIIQAQGDLVRAAEESQRIRNDLTGKLADAFERYENNRIILEYFRTHMLPDQVRAYRGVYERHQQDPGAVSFGDIINSQQILAGTITSYVATLGNQWQAVVDIARLLQTEDLFQTNPLAPSCQCLAPVPNLERLAQ